MLFVVSGLWAVVNNAGISGNKIGPSEWLSRDDFLDVMNTNFFGMINVTKAFLPLVCRLTSLKCLLILLYFINKSNKCKPNTNSFHNFMIYGFGWSTW